MSRALKYETDDTLVTDGIWYSLDTNSLLPMVRGLFDKVNAYSDINDPKEYLGKFFELDDYAKVRSQSILYELTISLMNVSEDDQRMLWKNNQISNNILLSPKKSIANSGNFNSLFFESFKMQISNPLFHLTEVDKNGGFYEVYLQQE